MLLFSRKFVTLIRLGRKTAAIRTAKYPLWKVGQRFYIPQIGYLLIDRVERLDFVAMTDQDASACGFESLAMLVQYLQIQECPDDLKNHLWRIDFHVLPPEEQQRVTAEKQREHELAIQARKTRNGASTIYSQEDFSEDGGQPQQIKTLTEHELVDRLINRCVVYRNICVWEHEPCKTDFFQIFLAAPRGADGIPTVNGEWLRLEAKKRIAEDEKAWNEIKWLLNDICNAWNQWLYAVRKWR